VALDASAGAHSIAELDFAALGRRAGLPEPTRQSVRVDSRGGRRYLDVHYEEWRVHVEIDGAHHLEPASWWADMKRQNELWISGDRVLRFPAWAVRERPNEVIAQVRAALRAAGWPG
jgi:very-short-patch-repair endonuclease